MIEVCIATATPWAATDTIEDVERRTLASVHDIDQVGRLILVHWLKI